MEIKWQLNKMGRAVMVELGVRGSILDVVEAIINSPDREEIAAYIGVKPGTLAAYISRACFLLGIPGGIHSLLIFLFPYVEQFTEKTAVAYQPLKEPEFAPHLPPNETNAFKAGVKPAPVEKKTAPLELPIGIGQKRLDKN